MRRMHYTEAADDALAQAMAQDTRIVVFGEDTPLIRRNLLVRFGGNRVFGAPISESAFVGAAVTAAMAGLRPVVELYMVDFLAVAMDSVLNHAAKTAAFTGGRWTVPMVLRAPCGGGYGDGGQHQQALWGWLAHIPGLCVLVPSTPEDAGRLMLGAIEHDGPVLLMEHKLLSEVWTDFLGTGGRTTVHYDVPEAGRRGPVPERWTPLPPGSAALWREGSDVTLISCGVGTHRAMSAAETLQREGLSAAVMDLRSVRPLDRTAIREAVAVTGRVIVVDEDYESFGLSGEIAAVLHEEGVRCRYARVCTRETLPYDVRREAAALPTAARIAEAARRLLQ